MPLGDRFERRSLIAGLYALSVVGLLISAASTSFALLLVGTLVTGLSSVAAQILVPFAATLAARHERGRVIGAATIGLIGAAGAFAANLTGKLADRGAGHWVGWGGLVMLLLAWLLLAAAPHSLWLLIAGVLLLDVAVQGVHIGNQSVIYQLDPKARNRITSAYVTCYFIGGAIGSSLGTAAYAYAGWRGVVVGGAALAVAALLWMGLSVRPAAQPAALAPLPER